MENPFDFNKCRPITWIITVYKLILSLSILLQNTGHSTQRCAPIGTWPLLACVTVFLNRLFIVIKFI